MKIGDWLGIPMQGCTQFIYLPLMFSIVCLLTDSVNVIGQP